MDYRVIVVDNASSDGTGQLVSENYPRVQLICNTENLGFAAANNIAIRNSSSCYIILLNSDCQVYPGSLDSLVDFMEKHGQAAIAGPGIINSDGTMQLSCRRFPSFFGAAAHSLLAHIYPDNPVSKKYKLSEADRSSPFKVDWVSGSCMIIRRKALDDTGLLDENYFMYVEDLDLCYRMWKKGWEVYYMPHSKILHHVGGSSRKGNIKASFRMQKSVFYFFWKNYRRSWKVILAPLLVMVLVFRFMSAAVKSIGAGRHQDKL